MRSAIKRWSSGDGRARVGTKTWLPRQSEDPMIMIRQALFVAMTFGTIAEFTAYRPALADDPCWDMREVINGTDGQRHDFPFPNYFGALPPEVKRCEDTGGQLMDELAKIRANPAILDDENQKNSGHGGRYNARWDCCKEWIGFRCQSYPPTPDHAVPSTHLEGGLCPVVNIPVEQLQPPNTVDPRVKKGDEGVGGTKPPNPLDPRVKPGDEGVGAVLKGLKETNP
jgi:hypothetical protein